MFNYNNEPRYSHYILKSNQVSYSKDYSNITNVLTFFSCFYLILYYIWDTISQRSYAIFKLKFKSYLFYMSTDLRKCLEF